MVMMLLECRLLRRCFAVMCDQMAVWMVFGRLNDPYGEFFICENVTSPKPGRHSSLTPASYGIRDNNLPQNIIDITVANDILFIGQVLNALGMHTIDATPSTSPVRRNMTSIGSPLTHSTPRGVDDYRHVFSPSASHNISAADAWKAGLLSHRNMSKANVEYRSSVPKTMLESVKLGAIQNSILPDDDTEPLFSSITELSLCDVDKSSVVMVIKNVRERITALLWRLLVKDLSFWLHVESILKYVLLSQGDLMRVFLDEADSLLVDGGTKMNPKAFERGTTKYKRIISLTRDTTGYEQSCITMFIR